MSHREKARVSRLAIFFVFLTQLFQFECIFLQNVRRWNWKKIILIKKKSILQSLTHSQGITQDKLYNQKKEKAKNPFKFCKIQRSEFYHLFFYQPLCRGIYGVISKYMYNMLNCMR